MVGGRAQVDEVEAIKKDPSLALKRIKELEEKDRKLGETEFSTRRKAELMQLHQSLMKRERRENEERQRQERIAEAARAKQREQEEAIRAERAAADAARAQNPAEVALDVDRSAVTLPAGAIPPPPGAMPLGFHSMATIRFLMRRGFSSNLGL